MSEPKPLTPEELADPEAWLCACGEDCMEFRLLATIDADRTEIARLEKIEQRATEAFSEAQPYRDSDTNELLNASPWDKETVLEVLGGILYGERDA